MKPSRAYWSRWAATLRRYHVQVWAAALIEAGGPLALLGAQALYFGRGFMASDQLDALAAMLEDEAEAHAFAGFLTEEPRR